MIQKVIREWLGVPYTNAEADELTQELNDRTVGTDDGYNSIQELGDATQAIETKTDLVTVTGAINLDTIATNVSTNNAKRSYPIADETKLSGIEASADVTDTTNVKAAGALMDSEVTNLAQVKAFDSADYEPAKGVDDNFVTDAEKVILSNTSGTNTGDQDISGIATNAGDITALDSAKAGLADNNQFTGLINSFRSVAVIDGTVALRILADEGTGETSVETANSAPYTDLDLKSYTKVVKSTTQTIALINTEEKALITKEYADATYGAIEDVTANTAKVSFDSTSSTRLANTSGTNTGDQDISGIGTNASAITAIEAITDVAIVSDTTSAGGGTAITNMVEITQAAYDLLTPDASTFYLING